jgi:cytochrome oxidase Cu insertion factor (SCO1/SenC/PrrC family)
MPRLALVVGLSVALAAAVVAVVVIVSGRHAGPPSVSQQVQSDQMARNPDVDPGTSLPGIPAPSFTLTNQFGTDVSLRQFRGKAVVLAFVDARCTSICPLTTLSMTEAIGMLGRTAARNVQLLGINANPGATSVADVHAYSVAHQMLRSWDFLTGNRSQLADRAHCVPPRRLAVLRVARPRGHGRQRQP